MEELPVEVLGMIFGFVPTKQLYPTCFVLSSTCLQAVRDEAAWRVRCEQDLGVGQLPEGKSSWFYHYRDSLLMWDSSQLKKTAQSFSWIRNSSITFPTADLVVWPDSLQKPGYFTVRSKQSFRSGVVALEFIIEQCNTYTWSVGFVDDNFDVCRRQFIEPFRDVCYAWCNKARASHSVTGNFTDFSQRRNVLHGWKAGDVLGALVDFDKREIQYFHNTRWNETVKLHAESKRLWAMANMYNPGNAVRIRIKSMSSRPPEWELR
ncbi:hypothetical protein QOT17_003799 [Balamuthia mandrillaris]